MDNGFGDMFIALFIIAAVAMIINQPIILIVGAYVIGFALIIVSLLLGTMFMGFFFLLFIGLIVYFIVKNTKKTPTEVSMKENTSLEILKKRYARGEIKKEEYDKIKKDLQG